MDLATAPAWRIADATRAGEISAVDTAEFFLARIRATDVKVGAWVVVDESDALEQARRIDETVAAGGDPGPLAGLPIGVKDVDDVAGFPTRYGSLLLADSPAVERDGYAIGRLRAAGAVIVGKTTTSEFGSVAFVATKADGVTRNPWNLERTSGGSSGGASAAIAAGQLPLATAGDGGGSIRIPAAFTGNVGMKATAGRIPFGPGRVDSTRCVLRGPMGRTVRDNARYIDACSGMHPMDRNSFIGGPTNLTAAIETLATDGMKVAWSDSLGYAVCERDVVELARAACDRLVSAGGLVEVDREVRWIDATFAWLAIMGVDLAAELQDDVDADAFSLLTPVVALGLHAAKGMTGEQIAHAVEMRMRLERQVAELFEDVDLLVTPTTPITAFDAEGPMPTEIGGRLVPPTAGAAFTFPFNLTGNPAISIPAGFVDGLPVGVQIVGGYGCDDKVIAAAAALEAAGDDWIPAPLA